MDASGTVVGTVAAIRSAGRCMFFVDIEVAVDSAAAVAEIKHGIALPQLRICHAQTLQLSHQTHANEQGRLQLMMHIDSASGEGEAAAVVWKQLLVGSVWVAVGAFTRTKRCVFERLVVCGMCI